MRLLGPDGQPIETGPPVSDEVKQIVERARLIAGQGDPGAALQQLIFAFQTDVTSSLVLDTTCDLLRQVMMQTGAQESEELDLFENLRANPEDPVHAYRLGNRFAQLGQTFVARPFLARAKELLNGATGDLPQAVDVDLAQVLMDLGAYQEAIDLFHYINDTHGGLHVGLILMMAECYALLRQTDEAEAAYNVEGIEQAVTQFQGGENWYEEVGDLIARVRDFDEQEEALGLRAWHYIQTRAMLLETNPEEEVQGLPNISPAERFVGIFQPSEEDVAYVVALAAAILDAKGYAPSRLLWLGESSEPLARLFAQWWEIEEENIRPYENGDNTDDEENLSLLVMAHSHDIFSLADESELLELLPARAGLLTFALDLRWTDRQPMTPDIAGFMSQQCNLPWETRMQLSEDGQSVTTVQETRDPQTIAQDIAGQFISDEESDQFAQETLADYSVCTDLILDHRDGTLIRRPLVAHSPVKSPRLGF